MKIQFLGTAAAEGIPALFCKCETCRTARELGGKEIRTRCQTLIDGKLMIDFGPDTYHHALTNGIRLADVHDYLITHTHADHLYPQEISMFGSGYARLPEDYPPFHFHGSEETVEKIASVVAQVSDRVKTHVLEPFQTYEIAGMQVTPLKATHGSQMPFIYIIESNNKRILYLHDTALFPAETEDYLYTNRPHFDLISFDCCFGTWENRKSYGGHMPFSQNRQIAQRMKEEGMIDNNTKLIVNHFSHNAPDVLYKDRAAYEKYNFIMTYDGLEIEI